MKGNICYIRTIEKNDIPLTQKWINDPDISEIMGYLPVMSLENQLDWFDNIKNDKSRFIFAICLNENHEHVGNVGLGNINYISRHAMMNIFIYDHKYRGKGIGYEASKLILDFAFKRINLNKVYLQTSERFERAINMYKKIGFTRDGVLRQHYYSNGRYEDKIIFSILKEEYL